MFRKNVVYAIHDNTGAVCYVGKSINGVVERWRTHEVLLRRGIHFNLALQSIYSVGKLVLGCVVIEECESGDSLGQRERYWIKHFRALNGGLCNLRGGGGPRGTVSAETRKKISDAKRGKHYVWSKEGLASFTVKQRARKMPEEQKQLHRRVALENGFGEMGRKQLAAYRDAHVRGKPMSVKNRQALLLAKQCPEACARGVKQHLAKLNDGLIVEIRRKYKRGYGGYGIRRLSQDYGVRPSTMHAIVTGKTWRHVCV